MDPVAYVEQLHALVDELLEPLAQTHAGRLQCRRSCSACCVDDLTVFEVEADILRAKHAELLASGVPAPEGACAFLDSEGACRVYADRPYVCRSQGLPLRWVDEEEAGELVEYRDICPLNAEGAALETLDTDDCWTLGPIEQRLAAAQEMHGEAGKRVPLRSLFGAGQ